MAKWKYDRATQAWVRGKERITLIEFVRKYGRLGSLDVVPEYGLNRMSDERKQKDEVR